MYIRSVWILSFAAFALATFPPEIQKKLFSHRHSLKLASHAVQPDECKPVARDSKWFATKPRRNSIAIARRGQTQTDTSSDCQSKLPKIMTQEEDRKWTNAKRLAAGFPIKPPKMRKPTRAGFPRQEPSAAPTLTEGTANLVTGSGDGTTNLGSIAYSPSAEDGLYEYVSGTDDNTPITLSIDTTAAQNGPTYITTTNGPNSAYPYLGAMLYQSYVDPADLPTVPESYDIGPGSTNYVKLGATTLTAPGTYTYSDSMVQQSYGYAYVVESSIYSIDSNGNIIATWTNADGSTAQLYFGMVNLSYEGQTYTEGPYGFGDKAAVEAYYQSIYPPEDGLEVSVQWVDFQFATSPT